MADSEKTARRGSPFAVSALVGLIVLIIVAVAMAIFAWRSTQPHPVPIGDIMGDLRTYDGQAVTVEGQVTQTLNAFGMLKTFQLRDETGEITIVTDRGLPNKGDTVMVSGVVSEVFDVGGVDMTVIKELKPED